MSHTSAFISSAAHAKLVADNGPRNFIPGMRSVVVSKDKTKAAETLSVPPTKPANKNCANKKRGKSHTTLTSDTTSSNFHSVTLSQLPQDGTGIRIKVVALLDTGS